MPEALSPLNVAKIITHFGQSKQISKALRVFYQHEKNTHTSTALVSAFVEQDLLSAWKTYRQYAPEPSSALSCLARAHYKKHPDYLRDNLRFAGFQGIDASVTGVVESATMNSMWKETVDLYKQVEKFEEPAKCTEWAIKAFAQIGDRAMTERLYGQFKCHASLARVLPELELVDFLRSIDNDERNKALYLTIIERLSGDARFAVEEEMNERYLNRM